ncbi:MAG: hypothetical protein H6707_20965 [Deltaproteobacteria bacterium]|nr:hypothetical protein [Deltaproteobacteria bacterium]
MIKSGSVPFALCATLLACQASQQSSVKRSLPVPIVADQARPTPTSQPAPQGVAIAQAPALRAIAFVPHYDYFYDPLPQSLCGISADRRLVCFPGRLPWLEPTHPVDQLARLGATFCAWSKQGETTCLVKRQRYQFRWSAPGRILLIEFGLCALDGAGRLQCRRFNGDAVPPEQLIAEQLRYLSRDQLSCQMVASQGLRCTARVTQRGHKLDGVVGAFARRWSRTALFPTTFVRGHHCGRDVNKSAWCWGDGYLGQRGDQRAGENVERSAAPSRVPLEQQVNQLAVSGASSCALTSDGAVYCWGEATRGAVPDSGALTLSRCPVDQAATEPAFARDLAARRRQFKHCMTRPCGGLDCRLGCVPPDAKQIPEHVKVYRYRQRCMRASPASVLAKAQLQPRRVSLAQRAIALIGSDATNLFCALLADGSVRCWGETHPKYGMSLSVDGRPQRTLP